MRGLAELNKAFSKFGAELKREIPDELRVVAEPVRQRAETLSTQHIAHAGPMRPRSWARMRTGVSKNVAYIAPVQRGRLSRTNPRLRRPNLANLLKRQMETALELEHQRVIARLERMLELIANRNGF